MNAIAITLVALFAATTVAAGTPTVEDLFRAFAQEHARVDLSGAQMTALVAVPRGTPVALRDGVVVPTDVPVALAHSPNCVNTAASAGHASLVMPVNVRTPAGGCGYQVHSAPPTDMRLVVTNALGGIMDAFDYPTRSFAVLLCADAGISGVDALMCGGFQEGVPLSAYSAWDGFVLNGGLIVPTGATAAFYG